MNFASKLNQTAVYWAPTTANDQAGNPVFASPVELTNQVRWEGKVDVMVNAAGEQIISDAVVYIDGVTTLEENGYMFEGALTDLTAEEQANPKIAKGAYIIRATGRSPSLRADQSLRKVGLGKG